MGSLWKSMAVAASSSSALLAEDESRSGRSPVHGALLWKGASTCPSRDSVKEGRSGFLPWHCRSRCRGRLVRCMAADPYSTLGVPRSASKQDVKNAYRKLARQYHPDVNKQAGAEEKFKEVSNAYEVLSDDEKRSSYDRFGEAGVNGAASANGSYGTSPFDIFESMFGSSSGGFNPMGGGMGSSFSTSRRASVIQGDDLRYDMSLEFNEAIFGTEKEFETLHLERCAACSGSGSKSNAGKNTCPTCGGRGQVMQTRETAFGLFSQVSICSSCGGEGEVIMNHCRKCGGEGCVRVKKVVNVKIPAGVNSGSTLRIRGEGDAGPRGGPAGDLYVFLNVREMPGIQRDGINLHSTIPVNYTDAILGTVVKVKTVEGPTDLQVPAGTQPGDVLVLTNMGVPKLNKPSVRGDHFFNVKVAIPTRLSDAERQMVEELASLRKIKGVRGVSSKIWSTDSERVRSASNNEFSQRSDAENIPSTQEGKESDGMWSGIKDFARKESKAMFAPTVTQSSMTPDHSISLKAKTLVKTSVHYKILLLLLLLFLPSASRRFLRILQNLRHFLSNLSK